MEVRAKITLRNNAMIAARKSLGWSQRDLAHSCNVSPGFIGLLEKFNYKYKLTEQRIKQISNISAILCLDVDVIWPPELSGRCVEHTYTQTSLIPNEKLSRLCVQRDKYLLPSPAELIENRDLIESLLNHSGLSRREIEVVSLKYGKDEYNNRECGSLLNCSGENIGLITKKAIKKMKRHFEHSSSPVPTGVPESPVEA